MLRGRMGAHCLADPQTRDAILRRIPLGRVAEPEDLRGGGVFFCGPGASFITGQVLYADGRLTATQ